MGTGKNHVSFPVKTVPFNKEGKYWLPGAIFVEGSESHIQEINMAHCKCNSNDVS